MSILGVARSCAVSLLGLGMVLPAPGAVPGESGRPTLRLAVHEFDIPPQGLAAALVTYSGVTGMAVLVDGELARGRRSARLQGRFTASDALARLLDGTGLMARYTSQEAFTLLPAQAARSVVASPISSSRAVQPLDRGYAGALQAALEEQLCRSPHTRPGTYRAVLQLWIGRHGEVRHSRLLGSTGDARRDGALVESLRGVRVMRATPATLAQPLTILLLPKATDRAMECTLREGVGGS
ncbi:TPA: TonB-dependent outer membrane receptor [Pseudomonas aeruginosa]|uniref:TonB-dependent outer membrane receptor n=1 Tax=Pseudomonas aeruginosa TaxID=287 RepID=A0ABD7JYC0_PSEAI|nr:MULTISPECIES: STN domain-containing protein [Pseudomonas aeruginosa group]KFF34287.1 VreA [Pseudomonas aeruginosa VRFPA01]KSC50216.1 TonB-dependent outer membrane receptor [Pseudomonas paraeruginosa]KSL14908.1 TonB-dependent outer membrane receptor [Pseudomonas aeruginosa]MBH8717328.1 STN domain-containing protein [Pseudomonas aeruginosa]MBH9399699.1 STN domain-containing protein [Pseudomonas aeruginosa]